MKWEIIFIFWKISEGKERNQKYIKAAMAENSLSQGKEMNLSK